MLKLPARPDADGRKEHLTTVRQALPQIRSRSKAMKDKKSFNSFIILWATQTLSRLGSSLTPFALVLWAYGQTGSALDTALLTVSSYLPYILLSLPVGALTDRLDKKRLILAADSLCALCTFMLFLSWHSGSLALWQLYLANAFSGLCQTFQQPASEVAVTIPLGYMLGGFLVDSVFEPVMDGRTDGALVTLFGSGKGSGAAFLFSVIGVLGLSVCVVFSRFMAMRHLED